MAHTFRNLSFEDPGPAPGTAEGWFTSQVALTELFAEFGLLDPNGDTFESFNTGWANSPFLYSLDILVTAIPAAYHPGVGLDAEDFEQQWIGGDLVFNHNSSSLETATYDSGANSVENFEAFEGELSRLDDGWPELSGADDGIPNFLTGPDRIQIASFDWVAAGFRDTQPITVRLSDGTQAGPNSDTLFNPQAGQVSGDTYETNGPGGVSAETGNAKTYITSDIEHDVIGSNYSEDFDDAGWPSMVGF